MIGRAKKEIGIWSSFFLLFISLAFSCKKIQETIQKSIIEQSKSLETSVATVESTLTALEAAKTSISSVKSARSEIITDRMVTSRQITARSPRVNSRSPMTRPRLSSPNIYYLPAPRLVPNQSDQSFSCSAQTEVDGSIALIVHFPPATGAPTYLSLRVSADHSSVRFWLDFNFWFEEEGLVIVSQWGQLLCVNFVAPNCPASESELQTFLDSLSSQVIQKCRTEWVNYYFSNDTFVCSPGDDYPGVSMVVSGDFSFEGWISGTEGHIIRCSAEGQCIQERYQCSSPLITDCLDVEQFINLEYSFKSACTKTGESSYFPFEGGACWEEDGRMVVSYAGEGGKFISKEIFVNDFGGWDRVNIYDCVSDGDTFQCKIYVSSLFAGEKACPVSFACDSPESPTDVAQYIDNISEICAMQEVGVSYSQGGISYSCSQEDYDQDGSPEVIRLESYPDGSTLITVEQNRGEMWRCLGLGNEQCTFLVANDCQIKDGCNITCTWKEAGYSSEGGVCLLVDIDEDGNYELVFGKVELTEAHFVVVGSSGNAVIKGDCQVGSSIEEEINCSLKKGACQVDLVCPEQGGTIDVSRCSLESFAECNSLEECMEYAVSFFTTYEVEKEECQITKNPRTGEFVEIKKKEGGYEYSWGNTSQSYSTLCPETSEVDFITCEVKGCEEQIRLAEQVVKMENYVEDVTQTKFSVNISNTKRGIEGKLDVAYNKISGEMDVSGELNRKDAKIKLEAKVHKDDSMDIHIIVFDKGGAEIARADIRINRDGSGEGELEEGKETYKLTFNADGTVNVCKADGSICEKI